LNFHIIFLQIRNVKPILRSKEKSEASFVKNVIAKSIIGLNQSYNGNVQVVDLEPPLEVAHLWNIQNYHFINGICVWLL